MKKPITVCATGLGHPEGPYELDDGRVIFANTYAARSASGTRRPARPGTYAFVGGGPNACMLGTDGCVYSTQTPECRRMGRAGAPPALDPEDAARRQGRDPRHRGGRREVRRPERPDLRPRRPALLHRFRRLGPGRPSRIPAASSSSRRTARRSIARGARPRLSERHRRRARRLDRLGRILHAARRPPHARRHARRSSTRSPEGHIPDGLKIDVDGNFWITTVASRRRRRRSQGRQARRFPRDRRHASSTASSARAARSICCDMGPFDTTGAAMTGRLIKVDVGVEGMPLFRGAIG